MFWLSDIWGERVAGCGIKKSEEDKIEISFVYWVCLNFDISFIGKDCLRICL